MKSDDHADRKVVFLESTADVQAFATIVAEFNAPCAFVRWIEEVFRRNGIVRVELEDATVIGREDDDDDAPAGAGWVRAWELLKYVLPHRTRATVFEPAHEELKADYYKTWARYTSRCARAWLNACFV